MNCALFYSYKNFKDTLFIIFDHNKSATSYKRNKDVVAIYHDDEIIGYKFVHLGKMMEMIGKGMDANEELEKAKGQYGRVNDAVKLVNPRNE